MFEAIGKLDPENSQRIAVVFDRGREGQSRFAISIPQVIPPEKKALVLRYLATYINNGMVLFGAEHILIDTTQEFFDEIVKTAHLYFENTLQYMDEYCNSSGARFKIIRMADGKLPMPSELPSKTEPKEFNPHNGTLAGLDIGRTNIKTVFLRDGNTIFKTEIPTEMKKESLSAEDGKFLGEKNISEDAVLYTADIFVKRIIWYINRWIKETGLSEAAIDGIGMGWAGAIRNNRIAGTSNISMDMPDYKYDDAPDRPKRRWFNMLAYIISREFHGKSCTIANDGDVDGFATHLEYDLHNAIFIKLGTSIALAFVNEVGALEGLTEAGRVVFDMHPNAPKHPWTKISGLMRKYVSSKGVENAARDIGLGSLKSPAVGKLL